jgi:transcription initiation factor TFIID subunit TAF12
MRERGSMMRMRAQTRESILSAVSAGREHLLLICPRQRQRPEEYTARSERWGMSVKGSIYPPAPEEHMQGMRWRGH